MQLPLNVILYQLSANSIYETQNIDLACTFDGVQLFDQEQFPEKYGTELYLVADQVLLNALHRNPEQKFTSDCVFLCICQDEKLHTTDFQSDLSMVLLYTDESFPLVFNRILNIFHDFDIWDKNFHLMLIQQKSLQDLLNLSKDFLVHPMVVLDRNYSILGYLKSPEVSDPIMESILSTGYVTPQIMERLRQDGLVSTSEQVENPLISWYSLTTHDCYYSMMYRFKANGHTVGYALIFHCAVHPRTNYLYLMNIVSENLQLFFQQKRFTSRSSSDIYESVFHAILEHPDAPQQQYEDQLSYIPDLPMKGRFMLAVIRYNDEQELPFSFVSWNLRTSIPQLKPFVYQNTLYILKNNSENESYATFLTQEEQTIFRKNFRNRQFECGISNTFFSLMDLPTAAAQAREALASGTARADAQTPGFYHFSDYYARYLLQELKKAGVAKMTASPCYEVLRQYDETHNGDLCFIFMQFLKNGRNVNQTAAAIFQHRNTVLNKVKKAMSIMQDECEDYQARIAFILSYLDDHEGE
ncbi:MAG: helix-turn-helix domain-containing protein [Lachnospiraceae bacterium]|nr:helix-turn-helix domain-containing protein [Lachnospiraceae bacterium]